MGKRWVFENRIFSSTFNRTFASTEQVKSYYNNKICIFKHFNCHNSSNWNILPLLDVLYYVLFMILIFSTDMSQMSEM